MLRPVSMMAITHPTCDPKKKPMKYKAIYKTRCVDIEILNVGGFDLFIKHRLVYSIVEKELLKAPAQRFALPACGRVWIRSEGSINPKPEKCLKMPQTPTRRVHAVLAAAMLIRLTFLQASR